MPLIRKHLIIPGLALLYPWFAVAQVPADLPLQKDGLWTSEKIVKTQNSSGQDIDIPIKLKAGIAADCLDLQVQIDELQALENKPGCTAANFGNISATSFSIIMSCMKNDGTNIAIRRVNTSVDPSHFITDSHITEGSKTFDVVTTWTFIGQCPSDVQAGDTGILLNGTFYKLSTIDQGDKKLDNALRSQQ